MTRMQLARKALGLFRSEFSTREQQHANARRWLHAMARLGDGHVLRGGSVTWGARQRQTEKAQ